VPECPVEAIHHETRVPPGGAEYIELNRARSAALRAAGPPLTEGQEPLGGEKCGANTP
jgi:hypothetical protein